MQWVLFGFSVALLLGLIGFMSFGGMLTGGDEAPKEEETSVQIEKQDVIIDSEEEEKETADVTNGNAANAIKVLE